MNNTASIVLSHHTVILKIDIKNEIRSMFLRVYSSLRALLTPTSVFLVGDAPKDCTCSTAL